MAHGESNLLFQLINAQYEHASTIITSKRIISLGGDPSKIRR